MTPAQAFVTRYLPPRRALPLLLGLALLCAGVLGLAALIQQRSTPVNYYGCLRERTLTHVDTRRPAACPPGARVIHWRARRFTRTERVSYRLADVLRERLSISGVSALLSVASVTWLVAGRSLRGSLRIAWVLVPALLFLGALCIAGPGHWFAKRPFEGPSLVPLGEHDALTLLDLAGLLLAGIGIGLGAALVIRRHRRASLA